MNIIKKDGFDFGFDQSACISCGGHCCTGESGYIWVKYDEIIAISDFLNLTPEKFGIIYIKKVKHRYSLVEYNRKDHNDFACIFFDEKINGCTIYPVRPLQCRTFPFWDQFKNSKEEVKKECPGIV